MKVPIWDEIMRGKIHCCKIWLICPFWNPRWFLSDLVGAHGGLDSDGNLPIPPWQQAQTGQTGHTKKKNCYGKSGHFWGSTYLSDLMIVPGWSLLVGWQLLIWVAVQPGGEHIPSLVEGSFICISPNLRIEENSNFDLSVWNKKAHISLVMPRQTMPLDHWPFGKFEEFRVLINFMNL